MICAKCGNTVEEGMFCNQCGTQAPVSASPPPQGYSPPPPPPNYPPPPPGYTPPPPPGYGAPPPMYESAPVAAGPIRSPGMCILYTIITLGIYYYYWSYVTNEQINALAGREVISQGMLILSWFCPPIAFYVWYQWDLELQEIAIRRSIMYNSNFILWVVLTIFAAIGSFFVIFQVQDTLNRAYGG